MTTAMIGATGRVGSEIVRGVLALSDPVAALVRDSDKARRAFGEPDGLHIRPTRLDDPSDLTNALNGIRTVFIAMGSIGIEEHALAPVDPPKGLFLPPRLTAHAAYHAQPGRSGEAGTLVDTDSPALLVVSGPS